MRKVKITEETQEIRAAIVREIRFYPPATDEYIAGKLKDQFDITKSGVRYHRERMRVLDSIERKSQKVMNLLIESPNIETSSAIQFMRTIGYRDFNIDQFYYYRGLLKQKRLAA